MDQRWGAFHYLPFTATVDATKVLVAKEMDKQGIRIDVARL